MKKITKTLYPEHKRLEYLPRFLGKHFLRYENAIYDHMRKSSVDYNGGYWDYYTLSNGGFYMGLSQSEPLKMECVSNYFEGEMSADAASIGVNLVILNAFAWQVNAEKYGAAFHSLRDYALEHAEAAKILGFID